MVFKRLIMSTLLLSILGISMSIPHCPMWKEIAPCTCRMDFNKLTTISCEKMSSYDQVVNLLKGHFSPADRVSLRVTYSKLDDLPYRNFKELNMSIENLKLNHDNLRDLSGETFDGLTSVIFFSLADNILETVPEHLWKRMPSVRTLDLGRTRIKELSESSFKDLPVQCLVLPGNMISQMDTNSFPRKVQRLHIGRNQIKTLNKTLTHLSDLIWLFANTNELTDLEDELPLDPKKLKMIHFSENKITRLPAQLKTLTSLESLFFQKNLITSLDGTFSKAKRLMRVVLDHNHINILTKEDFTENEMLESLLLGHNYITSLNNSLLNLRNLNFLNMTFNHLSEFSFQDIVGLQELRSIDLSHNRIKTLIGPTANLVEWNIKLAELKLDHNELESLDGALSGLPELLRLNLSFNKLTRISPDDLIGLDQLRLLDVSHNFLTTLEETSKTFLPRLEELKASHNYLTILEKDFHGLPVLCHADLSNNQIVALGRDLVSKTRCKIGHGIHEGTWDTLKIYLQDNPILCDAALPEITSAMEINHTRIYGVAHCPPLSEQPVTSKPNAFLGYVPDTTPSLPAAISANHPDIQQKQDSEPIQIYKAPAYEAGPLSVPFNTNLEPNQVQLNNNNLNPYQNNQQDQLVDLRRHEQYRIENQEALATGRTFDLNKPIPLSLGNSNIEPVTTDQINSEGFSGNDQVTRTSNIQNDQQIQTDRPIKLIDPKKQEKQLSKLASEIEELRSRVDQLATQNQILLNQQITNKSNNLSTEKPPNENLEEPRKP